MLPGISMFLYRCAFSLLKNEQGNRCHDCKPDRICQNKKAGILRRLFNSFNPGVFGFSGLNSHSLGFHGHEYFQRIVSCLDLKTVFNRIWSFLDFKTRFWVLTDLVLLVFQWIWIYINRYGLDND